jgi:hypothetical protein
MKVLFIISNSETAFWKSGRGIPCLSFHGNRCHRLVVMDAGGNLKALSRVDMIAKMVELRPATEGKFRNVFPNFIEDQLNPPDRNI